MTIYSSLLLASTLPSFTDGRGLRVPSIQLPQAKDILESLYLQTPFSTSSTSSMSSSSKQAFNAQDFTFSKIGGDVSGESPFDFSGSSLSLSANGQYLAVGAKRANSARGNVRTFKFDDDSESWLQQGQTIEGEEGGDEAGTSVSISHDGMTMAIGAPQHDMYYGSTKVYSFDLFSKSWIQLGQDLDGGVGSGLAGSSVALSGNGSRLAIGSPEESTLTGAVKVFEIISDKWTQLGSKILGNGYYSTLGNSLALSDNGDRLVVGSRNDRRGVEKFVGAVAVFEYTTTDEQEEEWIQLGSDLEGEAYFDHFGDSVDISGDGNRIVVGAPNKENGEKVNVGSAEVYQYDTDISGWVLLGNPMMGDIDFEQMGTSVSMSSDGNRIVVGSEHSDEAGTDAGKTWIFQYDAVSDEWMQLGTNIFGDAYDRAGQAVAMSADGKRFAIGAPIDNYYTGQTRIYEIEGTDVDEIEGTDVVEIEGTDVVEIEGTDGCADSERLVRIEVTTDANGEEENVFVVKKYEAETEMFSSRVWREENLQSSTTEVFEKCLPLNECYTFFLFDKAEDGMEGGSFKVTWDNTLVKHGKGFKNGRKRKSPAFGDACPPN